MSISLSWTPNEKKKKMIEQSADTLNGYNFL